MAWCYHDNQDFKSDLNIEVAREGDMLKEGQDLKDIECKKNQGHRDFIPFKDLTLEHLPIEDRNREIFDMIKKRGNRVVRLVVDEIKVGTGYVEKLKGVYVIKTNNHVVKTDDEVKSCTVDFHYDDDSRSSVLPSRGVKLCLTCPFRDITFFLFHPVPDFIHQLDWEESLIDSSMVIMYRNNQIVTKEIDIYRASLIKFYSYQNLNSPLNYLMFISHSNGSNSYLKSSYFKFQPIPSNIHQLTSIDVRIEDDGNSRVIPGDVVKFGDKFVVKISESIFQDEVKKCRLVWNGEVIGRGTRLYFQQVDVKDLYSGVELELLIELGKENMWLFDFHPIPRHLEDMLLSNISSNICCIGHPHGSIKMVTFGFVLDRSLEKFDNQYRHITKPGQNCKCKTVSCLKYSCKTCPGSSGSPVFLLNQKINIVTSLIHFMGESGMWRLSDGGVIENVNMAWASAINS